MQRNKNTMYMSKESSYLDEGRGAGRLSRKMYNSTSTEAAGPRNEAARQRQRFFKRGIIALPLMLLISGIVLEMTIAATLIVFYLLRGSVGNRDAGEALSVARSGVSDAAAQLVRKTNLNGEYTFTIDPQHIARVTVCNQGTKSGVFGDAEECSYGPGDAGKVEITSCGAVRGKNKCVRTIYTIDGNTGEIKIESSEEIAL